MPNDFNRTHRVADFLKKELATLIQFEMRDPRVGMASVTGVEVSRDLNYAKVFITVMGCDSDEEAKPAIDVLNKAAGFLRSEVAKVTTARTTPKLRFEFDRSIGRGSFMSSLIEKAVDEDHQRAEVRGDDDTDKGSGEKDLP